MMLIDLNWPFMIERFGYTAYKKLKEAELAERTNHVIAFSKTKEQWLQEGINHYLAEDYTNSGRTPLTGGKSRGLEEASVHWHTVVYANKHRAEGRVETILPEYGVFCKRPTRAGQYCHP